MASATVSVKPAGKRKLTWKECCNKWGKAAMEQQQAAYPRRKVELSRNQLAANIFAFVPETEWHKYYFGNRGGPSPQLEVLSNAIQYGEVFKYKFDFTFCPECDEFLEGHKCEECGTIFRKTDDNLADNMNVVARELGGYDAYYASTWSEFEQAKLELEEVAPTAGQLRRQARAAEKLLDKRSTRKEKEYVDSLWEAVEEAETKETGEASDASEKAAELSGISSSATADEMFPPLVGNKNTEVITTTSDVIVSECPNTQFGQINEFTPEEGKDEKVVESLVEEAENVTVPAVMPIETGFFFGTIPAIIPLPVVVPQQGNMGVLQPAFMQVGTIPVNGIALADTHLEIKETAVKKAEPTKEDTDVGAQKSTSLPAHLYPWAPRPKNSGATRHQMVRKWVKKTQEAEEVKQKAVWKKLDEQLAVRNEAKKDLKVKWRWGLYRLVKKTRKDNQRQRQKKRMEKEQQLLLAMPPQILTGISIAGGPVASLQETPTVSGKILSTPSMKRKRILKSPTLSFDKIQELIQATLKIACKQGLQVEIINKKTVKGAYRQHGGTNHLFLHLKHMEGWRKPVDLHIHQEDIELVTMAARVGAWNKKFHTSQLCRGTSGLVLNPDKLTGPRGHAPKGLFVVRGALAGVVYDARMRLGRSILPFIEQFSSTMERFLRGFDEKFKQLRQVDSDHVCESTYDAEQAGAVAAIIHHMVCPMNRTTCKHCSNKIEDLSKDEWCDYVRNFASKNKLPFQLEFKDFKHLPLIIDFITDSLVQTNKDVRAFNEIQTLIGNRTDAPFTTVCEVNKVLVKGGRAKSAEFAKASEALLELARYLKNRTENIKKGSLQSFRNKISQKAAMNLALMCDNQLDKNGNLIWGERGYHSKRFFSNYFEEINPEEGYSKYIVRSNPNGTRKLAIGKLIVSTNFSVFREQMKGEPIHKQKLDNHCTSTLDGNFIYPCCCVTYDDGQPMESEFKLPTKNHLVIGNSGDPKYVDMPPEISKKMYIAKEGYCYINIFLAMLVNVNEAEAKDFTKQVRDVLMEKLGKWPTMFDVATACAFMSVFYPETRNAELPRILIDHTTKTMHVIDSFGSLSTGYHILKANTVSQLIKFANSSLDSEMKHYLVGGLTALPANEERCVRTVIKGVYRP
nr:polyprotein [Sweet potato feathery mottle virus] [Sweet potato virus C]